MPSEWFSFVIDYCIERWNKMSELEREKYLEVLELPKSEAACRWQDLREQVRYAIVDDTSEWMKGKFEQEAV